jgi:CDP-diacylglycerol--serine O-phosphatidyltransferase
MKYFVISGYLIFFAMIADVLDGRVARMSNQTSSFGGQLDSLCDMISFGVAPAYLMLNILRFHLGDSDLGPVTMLFFIRFIWLASGVYVACAAIRLARFNVENEEDETSHMVFMGLPTPAAAGVIASIVIFYQDLMPFILEKNSNLFWFLENAIISMLPFVAFGVAILMISRIRYPHIANQYLKGKKPFNHLVWVLILLGFLVWNLQLALIIVFVGFALTGCVRWSYYRLSKSKSDPYEIIEQDVDEENVF